MKGASDDLANRPTRSRHVGLFASNAAATTYTVVLMLLMYR